MKTLKLIGRGRWNGLEPLDKQMKVCRGAIGVMVEGEGATGCEHHRVYRDQPSRPA